MQTFILMVGVFLALIGFVLVQSNTVHVHSSHAKASVKKQSRRSKRLGSEAMVLGGAMILFTWIDLFARHWSTTQTGIGILICASLIGIVEWRRRDV